MAGVKISIDRESRRSLTDQLADGLRAAVRLGKWKVGDRIPTRAELMAECGVSRNVVQAAVRRLVAEGLVCTRPRLGCIVARPSPRPVRGVVLEIDTGSGIPYWNACFSESLRRALSAERIDCRNIGLSYDKNNAVELGAEKGGSWEMYLAPGADAPHAAFIVDVASAIRSDPVYNTQYETFGVRRVSNDPGRFRAQAVFGEGVVEMHVSVAWENYAGRIPQDGGEWEFEALRRGGSGNAAWNGTDSMPRSLT